MLCASSEGRIMDIFADIINPVVDEVNEAQPDRSLGTSPDSPLFGPDAPLDSLGLVTFVMQVEERIEDRLGTKVSLVSERAMSRTHSPFRTMGSLERFISELLQEE